MTERRSEDLRLRIVRGWGGAKLVAPILGGGRDREDETARRGVGLTVDLRLESCWWSDPEIWGSVELYEKEYVDGEGSGEGKDLSLWTSEGRDGSCSMGADISVFTGDVLPFFDVGGTSLGGERVVARCFLGRL